MKTLLPLGFLALIFLSACNAQAHTPLALTQTAAPIDQATPISSCGLNQEVHVLNGTYDCSQYISQDGSLSCNFAQVPDNFSVFTGYEYIEDYEFPQGGGVYARNFGFEQFFVEYFHTTYLPFEVVLLFDNPATREHDLKLIVTNILLPARRGDFPETELISTEYLEDGLLFVQLYAPQGVYSYGQQEATYITMGESRFFFVSYIYPSTAEDDRLSREELKSHLDSLYQSCVLTP